MCLQAATSAINRLHGNLRTTSRIFSSTAVFITLSAATLIVAASLIPGLGVSLDGGDNEDPYRSALTKAFQVLDEHRYQVEGALRAKTLLQTFLERVKEDTRWRRDDGKTPEPSVTFIFAYKTAQEALKVSDLALICLKTVWQIMHPTTTLATSEPDSHHPRYRPSLVSSTSAIRSGTFNGAVPALCLTPWDHILISAVRRSRSEGPGVEVLSVSIANDELSAPRVLLLSREPTSITML